MRLIENIPHPKFKVSLHAYNDKYIVNITLDAYEQVFKIPQADVNGTDDLKNRLNDDFYLECMRRFLTMRENWLQINKV